MAAIPTILEAGTSSGILAFANNIHSKLEKYKGMNIDDVVANIDKDIEELIKSYDGNLKNITNNTNNIRNINNEIASLKNDINNIDSNNNKIFDNINKVNTYIKNPKEGDYVYILNKENNKYYIYRYNSLTSSWDNTNIELASTTNITTDNIIDIYFNKSQKYINKLYMDMLSDIEYNCRLFEEEDVVFSTFDNYFINSKGEYVSNANMCYKRYEINTSYTYKIDRMLYTTNYNGFPAYVFVDENDNVLLEGPVVHGNYDEKNIIINYIPDNTKYIIINNIKTSKSNLTHIIFKEPISEVQENNINVKQTPLDSCDLNDIIENSGYLLVQGNTYDNIVDGVTYGYIRITKVGVFVIQELFARFNKYYIRNKSINGTWSSWRESVYTDENKLIYTNDTAIVEYNTVLNKFIDYTGDIKSNSGTKYVEFYTNNKKSYHIISTCIVPNNFDIPLYFIYDENDNIIYKYNRNLNASFSPIDLLITDIPENAYKIIVNLYSKDLVNIFECSYTNKYINNLLTNYIRTYDSLLECDLNNIRYNSIYLLVGKDYINSPVNYGYLFTYNISALFTVQMLIALDTSKIYIRRRSDNSWNNWSVVGGSNIINNSYNYNTYNQSNTITCNPSITSYTDNYLPSTNDSTDRTNDILSLLQTTGICKLGTGTFVVNNLIMPIGSRIEGCGYSTKIKVNTSDYTECFGINMKSHCSISNLYIEGEDSMSETIYEKHGILWSGDFSGSNYAGQPFESIIDNVYISNFGGGAITCINTGMGTSSNIMTNNCYIRNCSVGINIVHYAEFNRFTNMHVNSCYYGCINHGGNNVFTSCDFSGNKVGFVMDNTNGNNANGAHGSAVGCTFNHINSNTGIAIKVINESNGFVFTGCQIFYGQIYIEKSKGVIISNSILGANNCDITVKDSTSIIFSNLTCSGDIVKNLSNNISVIFDNCYSRPSGNIIQ